MTQIPIYYINLASRPERRAFMETQFAALGLAATRLEATTPADLPAEESAATGPILWGTRAAVRACSMSHIKIWRLIIESGAPAGIVLEDDVILAPQFREVLRAEIYGASDADLIKLETWGSKVRLGRERRLSNTLAMHTLQSSHPGAAAYIVTASLARTMVTDHRPATMDIDRYLFGRGGPVLLQQSVAQMVPAVAVQLMHTQASDAQSDAAATGFANLQPANGPTAYRIKLARHMANLLYALRSVLSAFREGTNTPAIVPFADPSVEITPAAKLSVATSQS